MSNDALPQWETRDILGVTTQVSGIQGTGVSGYPGVSGIIENVGVYHHAYGSKITNILYVSFDGGVGYIPLGPNGFAFSDLRGAIKQIFLKSNNVSGVPFTVVVNRELPNEG